MSYRNPIEVFYYDKPFLEVRTIESQTSRKWVRVVQFPPLTAGFRIHNRGDYTISYAYQDSPNKWEELEAGVADFKTFCPRELWCSNEETVGGRDVDVYVEWWVPESEDEREDNEPTIRDQLKKAFYIFRWFVKGKG
jgi:hypothetical protein